MRVLPESTDAAGKTFEARASSLDARDSEVARIARELDAGVPTRFYRSGQPQGLVVAARGGAEGLWLRIHIMAREPDIWKLVETGAVNTVEVQALPRGVEVFLKSVAATYPTAIA